MSLFKYRALDNQGVAQNGTLEAKDQAAAVAALHKRGLLLLQIAPAGSQGLRQALGRGQLKAAALVSFTQQLATLLGAGQPLERSLGILLKQPGQPQVRALIERIREHVKAGKPLSKALEEEGSQFSPLYLSMVRAGEAGGALENTLRQLSDYLERSQLLRGEVINALIYPAFLEAFAADVFFDDQAGHCERARQVGGNFQRGSQHLWRLRSILGVEHG